MKTVLLSLGMWLLAADRLSVQLTPVLSEPESDSYGPVTAESLHEYLSHWENRTNVSAI